MIVKSTTNHKAKSLLSFTFDTLGKPLGEILGGWRAISGPFPALFPHVEKMPSSDFLLKKLKLTLNFLK